MISSQSVWCLNVLTLASSYLPEGGGINTTSLPKGFPAPKTCAPAKFAAFAVFGKWNSSGHNCALFNGIPVHCPLGLKSRQNATSGQKVWIVIPLNQYMRQSVAPINIPLFLFAYLIQDLFNGLHILTAWCLIDSLIDCVIKQGSSSRRQEGGKKSWSCCSC